MGPRRFSLPLVTAIALSACSPPPKAPVFPACDWPPEKPVAVMGEVRKPGTIQFAPGMTAYDALVGAGGFTTFARTTALHLRRCGRQDFRFDTPMEKSSPLDFKLSPGDAIFVPGGNE